LRNDYFFSLFFTATGTLSACLLVLSSLDVVVAPLLDHALLPDLVRALELALDLAAILGERSRLLAGLSRRHLAAKLAALVAKPAALVAKPAALVAKLAATTRSLAGSAIVAVVVVFRLVPGRVQVGVGPFGHPASVLSTDQLSLLHCARLR